MKLERLIHEENLKRLRKLLTRAPREDPHLLGIMRIAVAFRAIGGLDKAQLGPLRLQHNIILVLLLALAAAAWAVLVWQPGDATSRPVGPAIPCVLGHHDGGNDVSDRRAHGPRFP